MIGGARLTIPQTLIKNHMIQEQTHGLRTFWSRVCQLFMLTAFLTGFGLLATPTAQAQFSGAIYTTDEFSGVNINLFDSKPEVFLQGGPVGGGPGLPSGNYYCQVTTPSGALVLGKTLTASIVVTGPVGGTGHFLQSYQLTDILYTLTSGFTVKGFDDTTNGGGVYKVWISQDPLFINSTTKTDNFKVAEFVDDNPPQNPTGELCVVKFYDANLNGIQDIGEATIPGWKISVSGIEFQDLLLTTTLTDPECIVFDVGTYSVKELIAVESHWVPTKASIYEGEPANLVDVVFSSSVIDITLAAGDHTTVYFGNVCIGAGGGKTLGFWSNKNGQKLVGADDLAELVALNLRNANGSVFDPVSYNGASPALRPWLLNGTATNMSYMLSVQLAAMKLNVFNNGVNGYSGVSGASLVYAPQLSDFLDEDDGLNDLGFISVANLISAANTELGLHGFVTTSSADSAFRAYQEALKDALDDGNNNLNFLEPTYNPDHCPFSFVLP
jgi:hypothetical protein